MSYTDAFSVIDAKHATSAETTDSQAILEFYVIAAVQALDAGGDPGDVPGLLPADLSETFMAAGRNVDASAYCADTCALWETVRDEIVTACASETAGQVRARLMGVFETSEDLI